MGVSPMEQQEYSFTIALSSYLLRGLGDGRPPTRSINILLHEGGSMRLLLELVALPFHCIGKLDRATAKAAKEPR
jgi:hypothetical protein